jgi:hypothetical protein
VWGGLNGRGAPTKLQSTGVMSSGMSLKSVRALGPDDDQSPETNPAERLSAVRRFELVEEIAGGGSSACQAASSTV